MLATLSISSQAYSEHPTLMWAITPVIAFIAIGRLLAQRYHAALYKRNPIIWRRSVAAAVLITASCCGILYTSFLIDYGYAHWTFVIVVFWLTGISAGALVTLMGNLTILRLYMLLIFAPPLVASLYVGGIRGYSCAFGLLAYLVFVLLQGSYIHRIYWQQLIDRELGGEQKQELEQFRQVAEEANRAKAQFLAHMSHEIRTPMHGVLGVADLLLNTELTVQQKQLVGVLTSSAEGLVHVINDILDLSKVEAGRLTLEKIPVSVRALAQEIESVVILRAEQKQLKLKTEIDQLLPERLICDPVRLRQVLMNLLENAINFTPGGQVVLAIRCEESDGAKARVRFSVRDSGVGIPLDKQASVFEPFARSGGTGLGLSITRQIVEMMGGSLELRSNVGEGSCFSFDCELEQSPTTIQPAAPAPKPSSLNRPLHILVAEDNPINQLIVKQALKGEGHTVVVAHNGREAVDAALVTDFDVILMDNQMPELSGIEATRIIKAQRPELPIIAVSANAMEGDREAFLESGMAAYISKPFRVPELLTAINECLGASVA